MIKTYPKAYFKASLFLLAILDLIPVLTHNPPIRNALEQIHISPDSPPDKKRPGAQLERFGRGR